MSVWTHVAGIIRVDGLRIGDDKLDWDEIIGKGLDWEDPDKIWDDWDKNHEAFMPCGSEGSLKKIIWENPNKSSLASYTVSIFGDLRDYDNLVEIKKWFAKVCGKLWVRNAVITAECELGSRFTAYWDEGRGEVREEFTNSQASAPDKDKDSKLNKR